VPTGRYLLILLDTEEGVAKVIYWPDGGFPPPPPPDPETVQIVGNSTGTSSDNAGTLLKETISIEGESAGEGFDFSTSGGGVSKFPEGQSVGESSDSALVSLKLKSLLAGNSVASSLDYGSITVVDPIIVPLASSVAFPGAEGWGAAAFTTLTPAERQNGEVLFVTNLNNSGAGSFRQAVADCRSDRLSIIVFRVSGVVTLTDRIRFLRSKVYIAGQTAPGNGICFQMRPQHGDLFYIAPGSIAVRDFVMRGIQARLFKGSPADTTSRDVVNFRMGERILLDHCSFAYGTDEVLSFNMGTSSTESMRLAGFQRCVIAASLRPHSTGTLIGGQAAHRINRISAHHNFWSHNYHRHPAGGLTDRVEIIQNVVHNWVNRVGRDDHNNRNDYINNFWKNGPANTSAAHGNIRRWQTGDPPSIYTEGNVHTALNGNVPPANQQRLWAERSGSSWVQMQASRFRVQRSELPPVPVTLLNPGLDVYNNVIEDVGACWRLNADGSLSRRSVPIDDGLIEWANNNTGKPGNEAQWSHESHFFGLPSIASAAPYVDSNNDGIPDAWASQYLPSGKNAFDIAKGGFTYIEHFLNGTKP